MFQVKSLASVYTLSAQSRATRTYVKQQCDIARLSGSSVEQMLKEQQAQSQPEPPPHQSPASQTESFDQGSVCSSPHSLSVNPDPAAWKPPHDAGQPHTSPIPTP